MYFNFFKNEIKIWDTLDSYFQEVTSYLELLNEGEDVEEDAKASLDLFKKFIQPDFPG